MKVCEGINQWTELKLRPKSHWLYGDFDYYRSRKQINFIIEFDSNEESNYNRFGYELNKLNVKVDNVRPLTYLLWCNFDNLAKILDLIKDFLK